MKLNEQQLKGSIGEKEYSILSKMFPSSFLETAEDMVIPYMGKKRNVTMKLLGEGRFTLTSPVKYRILHPLYGIKYTKAEAAVSLGDIHSQRPVTITTPDYTASVSDEHVTIDGIALVKKDEYLLINYSSPTIYGLDKNYKITFCFRTTKDALTYFSFEISSKTPTSNPGEYSRSILSLITLDASNGHFNPNSIEFWAKHSPAVLEKIKELYHERVQTKESDFFDESMRLIEKFLAFKEQGQDWKTYQRAFQESLPDLFRTISDCLAEVAESIESDFYMENHEIQRLIKARTSISKKLTGEK